VTGRAAGYIGRFAPSPTGPLHFGSLLAAVASYAQARVNGGRWLLRIEDIDPPRALPGAERMILDALAAFGFEWDGDACYQSTFTPHHQSLVKALVDAGHAYPCSCSRSDLADAPRGPLGIIYPGTCRRGCAGKDTSIRLRTNDDLVEFIDGLQGPFGQRLESESGDFIIRRRDGLIAYNMAVVVDDADQGITEVVRGIDLLDSTPRHIYLQRLLGFSTPDYLHIPIAVNPEGQKLSKLTGAVPLDLRERDKLLFSAFRALAQEPPAELEAAPVDDQWDWLFSNWQIAPLTGAQTVATDGHSFG
jgi:glutamyl-Q tRNA(Asp) synthetase